MKYPHLKDVDHCVGCGSLDGLMKSGTSTSGRISHRCTSCNSERCKAWRNKDGNMKKVLKIAKTYETKNPLRRKAWSKVRNSGVIKRPCQVCGIERVHAHHPRVNQTLLVVFLCPLHHKQVHAKKITCPKPTDYALA